MPNSEMRAFKFVTEKLGKMFSRDKGMMDSFNRFVALERAEARREALTQAIKIAEHEATRTTDEEYETACRIIASRIRLHSKLDEKVVSEINKLAAPEKEETNG